MNLIPSVYQGLISQIVSLGQTDAKGLADLIGGSFFAVSRWVRGDAAPTPDEFRRLEIVLDKLRSGKTAQDLINEKASAFASRGARKKGAHAPPDLIDLNDDPGAPILRRLKRGSVWGDGESALAQILSENDSPAYTPADAIAENVSAGKNTYTYDAHTYHTKVPPQGIATVLNNYLPEGGVVLDPFGGSGMTGVAAMTTGHDVLINELSPAASFISRCFTRPLDPMKLEAGVHTLCEALRDIRRNLYTTKCRTCGSDTELLFTVWSYNVVCSCCDHEFCLWDHSRSYGNTVREHKFLKEFPCPKCGVILKKSRLKRTTSKPVMVGYKCCSRFQSEVEPSCDDLALINEIEANPDLAKDFYPRNELPEGVNLSQPRRHGLTTVDRFYTTRNLVALSRIWELIHRVPDDDVAAFLAFVFTSLYQRVTRMSEYRFWGGSGNTANFNVPYISNEANVFVTFERKAKSIIDHLSTTAKSYRGRCVVNTGSATDLRFVPSSSVDLIFTDPPFGANINYSEMNILWESWLGDFTDASKEAIVSRVQKKDASRYQELMTDSLKECFRVLRPGHWMVLVFMNSSEDIWERIRSAILDAGFSIEKVDIFDKQHGTFKQFVSENTAGADLMLHCKKPDSKDHAARIVLNDGASKPVSAFLRERQLPPPKLPFLHVKRDAEVDFRTLYSEYLAATFSDGGRPMDFSTFRREADGFYSEHKVEY